MEKSALQEILTALKLHSDHIDGKLDKMRDEFDGKLNEMKTGFDGKLNEMKTDMNQFRTEVNERFDRMETKFDAYHIELRETQETVDYLASKNLQHERKLRQMNP